MRKKSFTLASALVLVVLAGCQMDEMVMAPNATPEELQLRAWFSGASTESPPEVSKSATGDTVQCPGKTLFSTNGVYRFTFYCSNTLGDAVGEEIEIIGRWQIHSNSLCMSKQRQRHGDRTLRSDELGGQGNEICYSAVISGDVATITRENGNEKQETRFLKVSQAR